MEWRNCTLSEHQPAAREGHVEQARRGSHCHGAGMCIFSFFCFCCSFIRSSPVVVTALEKLREVLTCSQEPCELV